MYIQPVKTLSAIMVPFSNMLPCVLACRLILDLRQHGGEVDNDWIISEGTNPNRQGKAKRILNVARNFAVPAFASEVPAPAKTFSTIRFRQPTRIPNPTASGSSGGSSGLGVGLEVVEMIEVDGHEIELTTPGLENEKEKDVELGIVEEVKEKKVEDELEAISELEENVEIPPAPNMGPRPKSAFSLE